MSGSVLKAYFDLVQPVADLGLLRNQRHEQAVMREERTSNKRQDGECHADDAGPVANGKLDGVGLLDCHCQGLVRVCNCEFGSTVGQYLMERMLLFNRTSVFELLVPFDDGTPIVKNVGATENAIAELDATVPPFRHRLIVLVVPLPGYAKENAPFVLAPDETVLEVVAEFDPLKSATRNAPAALIWYR
jgi:hypothetical protein